MYPLKNILFLDIETVGCTDDYDSLSERLKAQWARKAAFLKKGDDLTDKEVFEDRAGIFAEFGKIVAIGLGFFSFENEEKPIFRTKALFNHDENIILTEFVETISKFSKNGLSLCAHNGREFDFPYLSRRLLINGLPLPEVLNLMGKKPWEVQHIDTMDMWKFGDWKHYTSLDLLATIFNITSSKSDIDGSEVNQVYYETKDLRRIAEYCLRDVVVTAKLFLKLKSIPLEDFEIIDVTDY
ncbi:3'-5' exonuclease [Fulvivirga maritima]|uniref:3'-5' exonuclease n=1 Tax=Fulvivirga maritima TaxID=2904247 RepID=UPI001F3F9396|nr:3'-5' exonuclease [Fulvivirga maritima]UII28243.1 3'-5' exonuclease [Fulvivirga maritima]